MVERSMSIGNLPEKSERESRMAADASFVCREESFEGRGLGRLRQEFLRM